MGTFEDENEEMDVVKIMEKIREKVRQRGESSALAECEVRREADDGGSEVARDLEYISSNWGIQNNSYYISSHRPVMGRVLVRGRELVHGEVCRYVDPMVFKQNELNASTVRILGQAMKRLDEIAQKTSELEGRIGQVRSEIGEEVEDQVRAVVAMMNEDIENKAWLAGILERRIGDYDVTSLSPDVQNEGANYFVFEERFRGSRQDIKERQSVFVQFFEQCKNVLDIGCGRGEFLELLRDKGIGAHGVDIDEDMVEYCRVRGLDVENTDAIAYLEKVEDKSLDGVFLDQVVEHLEPDYLIKMLGLCYKTLKYGCYIIIETVNPLSFVSFANFYIDLTHKKPVHPETMKFLLGSVGFREIETSFFSPVRDEARLKRILLRDEMNTREESIVEVYNQNVEMLNSILYGAQDYAVTGKK